MLKKLLSLILCSGLLISIFSGCSGSAKPTVSSAPATAVSAAASPAAASKAPAPAAPANVTVNVMYDFNMDLQGMPLVDNKYTQFVKSKTGIDVKMDSPGSANYVDKVNIVMASGNYPDAVLVYDRNLVLQFAKNGVLTDLTPYINDKAKYPNTASMNPDAFKPVVQDSKIWAFPYERQDALNQIVYVRKEWMSKLGLSKPKTIDEFYNVLKAFTDKDPDGNGKNDTFGLLMNKNAANGGRSFFAAFDAQSYKIIDGLVTPPEIQPQYKDALKFLNKLVQEKITDSEYPTITTNFTDKLKTNKYGMTSFFWHGDQLPEYANKQQIAAVWDTLDFPLKKDGSPSKMYYSTINRHYIIVPAKTKNVENMMKLFDWAVGPDGTKYQYLGIENVEYKEEGGKFIDSGTRHPTQWMFSLVKNGVFNDNVKKYMAAVRPQEAIDRLQIAINSGQLDKLQAYLPYYPELSKFNLTAISDEFRDKSILGNVDIDKEWDAYVSKWKSAGGQKAMQFWTDWYNKDGKDMVK